MSFPRVGDRRQTRLGRSVTDFLSDERYRKEHCGEVYMETVLGLRALTDKLGERGE